VRPGGGRQLVEVVVTEGLGPRPADGIFGWGQGIVLQRLEIADGIVAEDKVVEGVADRQRRRDLVEPAVVLLVAVGGDDPVAVTCRRGCSTRVASPSRSAGD
jgi:hypothetical protein